MTNKQRIQHVLIGMAEYYGEPMTAERLAMSYHVLEDLDAEDVARVAKEIMCDPNIKRFPVPATIRGRILPSVSVDVAAQDLLTRAISAVAMFGHHQPDAARQYLGEIVWSCLPGLAGWEEWCASPDFGILRAQLRERLKSELAYAAPSGLLPASEPLEKLPSRWGIRSGEPTGLLPIGGIGEWKT